jgi:cysteine desulfurase
VLVALGIAAQVAQTAVRFTLDGSTTSSQVSEVVERVADAVATVGGLSTPR